MSRSARLVVLSAALLVCSAPALARQRAFGNCELGGQTVTTVGISSTNFFTQSFKSCTVTVYLNNTLTLATLYSDNAGTTLANPFTASATGFWFWYADNGRYDVSLTGGGIVGTITIADILLLDLGGTTGITSLNGLTGATQTFATGTSGSDFNISSSGTTHTFNFPSASASNRGLLLSADWTTFNAKQAVLSFTAPLSLSGTTVSLTLPLTISQGGTNSTTALGAFQNLSPMSSVGDLLGFNGNSNRFAVGSDATVLTADHTQAFGFKWATCALCAIANPVPATAGGTGLSSVTSGGVLYGASGTTIASSGALGANLPVFGGGAGAAPFTGTRQGNTTAVTTYSGSAPGAAGNCPSFDNSGATANLQDSGVKCNGTLFSQTATTTIANTGVETSVVNTGVGSVTLPSNFWAAGKSLQVRVLGFHSSVSSATIRFKVKLAGTIVADTTAVASNNGTNASIDLVAILTCYTTGVSGTLWTQGYMLEAGASPFGAPATGTTTVNTTTTGLVDVTFQWGTGSSSNTITVTNVVLSTL